MKTSQPSKPHKPLVNLALALGQRLAFGVLVLVFIIFLSHLGLDMARGTDFQPAALRAVEKTVAYLGQLMQGDLGLSMAGSINLLPVSVAERVPDMLFRSLGLLFTSLSFAAIVGVILGIWAAKRAHSGWSLIAILASIIGVSVPSFLAALILQLAVIRLTQVMGRAILPVGGFGWDKHIIIPALVLAARPLAQITRVTFVTVSNILEQDYIRTAHSKGLRQRRVMSRHVIRNAAIAILTTVGLSLRFSLSSLPVVEFIFSWPGLGFTLLKTIAMQDDNLTVALVLCLGILFILVNLLLDLSYRLIDPRSRETPEFIKRGERRNLLEWGKSILDLLLNKKTKFGDTDNSEQHGFFFVFNRYIRGIRVNPCPISSFTYSATSRLSDLRNWMASSPVKRWFNRCKAASPRLAEPVVSKVESPQKLSADDDIRAGKRRAWIQSTLGNFPLMVGGILIAGLLVIIVFSSSLAPHSPYTTHGLTIVDGEFSVPPFEPDEIYPWGTDVIGRDIMSLIIAGAQQTLFLTVLVVLARMVVGFSLGAVAGWLHGSWIDRLLLRMSEIIAAFPTLLLAMILILALGIRQGMLPFIIALCFVGWGDIMQLVRGEVMSIRPQLFIESAVALGLRTPRIILKHVLPNLIPILISIVALEMGAVLMLLGELGFIGIFIGGGAFAELAMYVPPYHYSDVPEWSALLSSIRPYARSYPWTATYPALAFFVAILGFNLFGEGIRRMVERIGVEVTRLITNRYTVAVSAIIILGFVWMRGSTGYTAFYQRQADAFDGQQVMTHVEVLSDPALYGRAVGTSGVDAAAEYIAEQFELLDIQPAGEHLTYFQTRSRSFELLDALPILSIKNDDTPLVYHQDYVEYPGENRNLGEASGPVRFVALGELTRIGDWGQKIPALEELDYSDEILLTLAENDLRDLEYLPRKGILIVARDPVDLRRHYTLSFLDPHDVFFGTQRQSESDTPILWISEAVADRLMEGTGYTVRQLRNIDEGLDQDEIFEVPTGTPVSMEVQGSARDNVSVRHVIGHLPGTYGQPGEFQLDNKMIVVLAQYDSPPLVPDGVSYPAANDNASGVAVMLETIRIMQETGYQPYKTFLFVAYSGEGLEGGAVFHPEVSKFLQTKYGFSSSFEVEAIVELRGLGAESGDNLLLSGGGSLRLANLFESAARRMGVPIQRAGEQVDLSIVFDDRSLWEGSQEAPSIGLSWDGWETTARTSSDIIEAISVDNLEEAGRALSLALMILGRETQY